jgi:hypothetical protein
VLLSDLPKTLLRRWYITLGGLLLTVALCFAGLALIPPTQRVESSILLLPPRATVKEVGNPYLGLGGLKQPVDVLVKALSAQPTTESVMQKWPDITYEVMADYSTSGPILILTVDGKDDVQVLAASEYVRELAGARLDELQANLGVRPTARIISTVLTKDDKPKVVRKTQIRALVVLFGGGLMLTILVAGAVDTLAARKKDHLSKHANIELNSPTIVPSGLAEDSTGNAESSMASNGNPSPGSRDELNLVDSGEWNHYPFAETPQSR